MSDESQLMSDAAWERLLEAKHDGGLCAACGRMLDADEPVWNRRLQIRRTWDVYFAETVRWGLVDRECATPEVLEASEGRETVACKGCGRAMHYTPAQMRRAAVCSARCRLTVQRRQSKGGQLS